MEFELNYLSKPFLFIERKMEYTRLIKKITCLSCQMDWDHLEFLG